MTDLGLTTFTFSKSLVIVTDYLRVLEAVSESECPSGDEFGNIMDFQVLSNQYELGDEKISISDFCLISIDGAQVTVQINFSQPDSISASLVNPELLKITILDPYVLEDNQDGEFLNMDPG